MNNDELDIILTKLQTDTLSEVTKVLYKNEKNPRYNEVRNEAKYAINQIIVDFIIKRAKESKKK